MAFDSFGDFLAMGTHGFYVWLAYGLTFIVLAALAWQSVSAHGSLRRELAAQRRRNSTLEQQTREQQQEARP